MPLAAPALMLSLLLATSTTSTGPDVSLRTEAERSDFQRTGRIHEVDELCSAFARAYPDAVRCDSFGRSAQGRNLPMLVVSRSGALTSEQARMQKLPVVLVQGGIHAGEIDGKDAGFLALRHLLDGSAATGALDSLVVVFVPVFNVDGHERFGAWNRPNQRGPEQMGWRTTARNLNLNRDYMKADAPEMRAMLELINHWDPLLLLDLHVTDGAQFEHDISLMVDPVYSGDVSLRVAGLKFRDAIIAVLSSQGSLPLPFYPSFVEGDNPASGFADGVGLPRFSTGYPPLRNRFAMLVETHSWKDYPTRVRITRNTIVAVLSYFAAQGKELVALAAAADTRAAELGGQEVALNHAASTKSREIEFRGYAYTRTPSEVSGALMTRYDESSPQVWKVPLRDEVLPSLLVTAPRGGYLIPAEHTGWMAPLLELHGISYERIASAQAEIAMQRFQADKATFAPRSFEGRQMLSVEGRWIADQHAAGAGDLFVPIAQAHARLLMALLEPQAPDSLLAWGSFNNNFEQKEYMEPYVAEAVARKMLASDADVRKQFEQRLATEPEFAASPTARLEFFHRRHESWDQQFGRYPVWRTDIVPSPAHAGTAMPAR